MQEEITQGAVTLCIKTNKLTADILQKAMKEVLEEIQKGASNHKNKLHQGKQTLEQLKKHGTGLTNIEITEQNIKAFSSVAKEYKIDYALKKASHAEPPFYYVFFKSRDKDQMEPAFREFTAMKLNMEKKPSIRERLAQAREQAAQKAEHRTIDREKVKVKDRSVQR